MSFYSADELNAMGFQSLGADVRISTKASIYGASRISLGPHSRVDDFCVLSAGAGGIHIGRNVHIAIMCSLIGKGRIELHDFSGLSSRVSIYSSTDDYSGEYMTNPTVPEEFTNVDHRGVVLQRHVIIGAGAVILPGVTIGEGSAVGALGLVSKDLEPFGIYAGAPLKRIKSRSRGLLNLETSYLRGQTGNAVGG